MRTPMTDSLATLRARWSEETFLRQAARRRDHLAYTRISFAEIDPDKEYIISLLPQAQTLHDVKEPRNQTVHKKIPLFTKGIGETVYRWEIKERHHSREIDIPENDVSQIADPPQQITAWHCLKQTRKIIKSLLNET